MVADFMERVRTFALSFDGASEAFSFGDDHPVYKAANGKMFAISSQHEDGTHVSLKLSPEEVLEAMTLPFVRPAPYLAKNHWVMPVITNETELDAACEWIARSHQLVTAKPLRKRQ